MRARDIEKKEAQARLREWLHTCGPQGSGTLEINLLESRPSSSGVAQYLDVRIWELDEGRPRPTMWLTFNVAKACGFRFCKRREAINMGGYGYCRASQIAEHLADIAGHPIRIEAVNTFAGPRGWYPREPEEIKKTG